MNFPENVSRLCSRKRFSFECHSGLACFTECCRELELALTPFDVLWLCKELQLSSAEFIDRYVIVEQGEKEGFPRLYLGMVDDGRASCPFISANGCRVYNSRPGACRAYPVGRGVTHDAEGNVREMYVLVREAHCRGFAESNSHSVAEWFENQGLKEYNVVNDEVFGLLQYERDRSLTQAEKDLFLLALYKLDEFRKLVCSSAFYDKYLRGKGRVVPAADLDLLRFGIRWLQEVLSAEKR